MTGRRWVRIAGRVLFVVSLLSAANGAMRSSDVLAASAGTNPVHVRRVLGEELLQQGLRVGIDCEGHVAPGGRRVQLVRARRVQGKGDDSVVKLRPVVPSDLSPELRKNPRFGVEVDAMPGGFVCSGSLKGVVDPEAVRNAVAGESRIRKLFSKQQRAFVNEHTSGDVDLDARDVCGHWRRRVA